VNCRRCKLGFASRHDLTLHFAETGHDYDASAGGASGSASAGGASGSKAVSGILASQWWFVRYSCATCARFFVTKKALDMHVRGTQTSGNETAHKAATGFACSLCEVRTSNKKEFDAHLASPGHAKREAAGIAAVRTHTSTYVQYQTNACVVVR
jgi:hypothetical protein